MVFNYIQFLRKSAPQELIFKEIKAISEIRFRFAERPQPAEYVSGLAARLQQPIPREKIISSQWLTERFDPVAVDSAVQLLDMRRSNIIVTAKSMPPGVGPLDQVEPIFGTRFRRDKMSEEFIDKVRFDFTGMNVADLGIGFERYFGSGTPFARPQLVYP
jgi:insulysin